MLLIVYVPAMYVPFRLTRVLFNMDGVYLHLAFYFVWYAWIAFRETDRRDRYEHIHFFFLSDPVLGFSLLSVVLISMRFMKMILSSFNCVSLVCALLSSLNPICLDWLTVGKDRRTTGKDR
jgi:hypothetical protein